MDYFTRAIVAAVLVGLVCGLVGTLVVLRRRAFFTVALTHATFPGGVIAAIVGIDIVLGAGLFGVLLVGLMTLLSRERRQGPHVAAGIVLTLGYALGMLVVSLHPNLPIRVDTFLTGSILTVSDANLVTLAVVLAVVLVALLGFGTRILFSTFDRRGAEAAGFGEGVTDALVLGIIALSVAACMPAIGSILAIAMIAAPAAAARLWTGSVGGMLALSCVLGVVVAIAGLLASRAFGLAAGGSIAITASLVFVVAFLRPRRGVRRSTVTADETRAPRPAAVRP